MPVQPVIVDRADQPYVAAGARVTMQTIAEIADRIPEVFGWLGARGVEPAGAPFLRYHVIDMAQQLEIEAGVPVATTVDGDDRIVAGVLPAGRYATVVHVGAYDGLRDATAALLDWAAEQGLAWDMTETAAGERWGGRVEWYLTNPAAQPDPGTWRTELAFRLAT